MWGELPNYVLAFLEWTVTDRDGDMQLRMSAELFPPRPAMCSEVMRSVGTPGVLGTLI